LLLPLLAAVLGSGFLVLLYLGLVTWAQGLSHARELLWGDRHFVAAIALGFGLQVGLYAYLRLALRPGSGQAVRARLSRSSTAVAATGTGTSTVAMVACCAHHVTDALPVLGLSGVAIFLNDYRLPFMAVGLAINAIGVLIMLRLVVGERRRAASHLRQVEAETSAAEVAQ